MPVRFAQSLEDLPTMADQAQRSGLEFMQDVASGKLCGPPIGETLGFNVAHVEDGKVIFEGVPDFKVMNPLRGVHGSWFGAIMDSCMACAVMSTLKKGTIYTTLEYKVNITRALPLGTKVHAIGIAQHSGRSTAVASGELRGVEDGKLYATGSTTCLVMKAPELSE